MKQQSLPLEDLSVLDRQKKQYSKEDLHLFFDRLPLYISCLLENTHFKDAFIHLFRVLARNRDPRFKKEVSTLFNQLKKSPCDPSIQINFGIYLYYNDEFNRAIQLWDELPLKSFDQTSCKRVIHCLIKKGNNIPLLTQFVIKFTRKFPFRDENCQLCCQFLYNKKEYDILLSLVDEIVDDLESHATLQRFEIFELAAKSAYFYQQDLSKFEAYADKAR